MWKNIKGYEGLYQISDEGEVRSLNYNKTGKAQLLKPADSGKGYLFVGLCKNGKRKKFKVHRLVAMAFIPNPSNLPYINHKDENKENNCVSNLEWCDRKYNNNYGTRNQRIAEKTTNGKLSKPVRQYDLKGNFIQEFPSTHEVERKFGYNNGNISATCNGNQKTAYGYRWKWSYI